MTKKLRMIAMPKQRTTATMRQLIATALLIAITNLPTVITLLPIATMQHPIV
jgi:hypothetical protein